MGILSLAVVGSLVLVRGPSEVPEATRLSRTPTVGSRSTVGGTPPPVVVHAPPQPYSGIGPAPAARVVGTRLLGVGLVSVGAAAFVSTVGLQLRSLRGESICARGSSHSMCLDSGSPGATGLRAIGLFTFMGGGLAAGAMFGRARAMADASRGSPQPKTRHVLSWVGASLIVGSSSAIMLTHIVTKAEKGCRADPVCGARLRRGSYSVMNVSSIGVGLGAALCGYVVAERRGWNRGRRLSVNPTLTRSSATLSLSAQF